MLRKAFLSALTSIHKANVIHNDIRPDNLTIDSDGRVFIIDFAQHAEEPIDELKELNDVLHGKFNLG